VLQLMTSTTNIGCQLASQLWMFSSTARTKIGDWSCVGNETAVTSLSVTMTDQIATICGKGQFPGVLMYSSAAKSLYAAYLCVDITNGNVFVNGGKGDQALVDVGTHPSLSLYQFNGQVFLFEVHGDGYCWNSEINNKRSEVRLCNNVPTSTEYILTYNFGTFDSWISHINNKLANKTAPLDTLLGSCHSQILHGTYDSGTNPHSVLFSAFDYSSKKEALLLAEIHVGLPSHVSDKAQCGMATPMDGLVLDAWPLADWVL